MLSHKPCLSQQFRLELEGWCQEETALEAVAAGLSQMSAILQMSFLRLFLGKKFLLLKDKTNL